jgi:hypothetical protein
LKKSVEELLERMSALKVIDLCLYRNTRSGENWSPAENFRIGVKDRG